MSRIPTEADLAVEALRLAGLLERMCLSTHWDKAAAAELRRLHAVNAQLLDALDEIAGTEVYSPEGGHEAVAECNRIARAAIAAAKEGRA